MKTIFILAALVTLMVAYRRRRQNERQWRSNIYQMSSMAWLWRLASAWRRRLAAA
jgi:hypothetical protein